MYVHEDVDTKGKWSGLCYVSCFNFPTVTPICYLAHYGSNIGSWTEKSRLMPNLRSLSPGIIYSIMFKEAF